MNLLHFFFALLINFFFIIFLSFSSFTAQTLSQEIGSFFRRCCQETLKTIEKCENIQSYDLGESYYRLAIYCLKHHRSGSNENQLEMSKLLIKSISRGMRYNSKNARLQFPRLLQLPTINTVELTAVFNDEVKTSHSNCSSFKS